MNTQTLKSIFALTFIVALILPMAAALNIKDVTVSPNEVEPGQNVKISLEIENELGEDLENVLVSLNLNGVTMQSTIIPGVPFAPYQSSTDRTIEQLDDGDEETVEFELIAEADAEAGIYKIPVKITYNLENQTAPVVKESSIGVTVNAEPELQLNYDALLIKGQKTKLNLEITNAGLTKIKFLNAEINNANGLDILSSKKVYVGDIESDDFDNVEFEVFVSKNAGSTINLPVKLTYRDAINNQKTETINMLLTVYSREQALEKGLISNNNTMYYVAGAVVLIVAYIIYRKIRKARKRRKQQEN